MLITFANSLNPNQDRQYVWPDLDPILFDTLIVFLNLFLIIDFLNISRSQKQVTQWAHLGASIMFGDTIIYDDSELETVIRNKFKHSRYLYAGSGYLQVL